MRLKLLSYFYRRGFRFLLASRRVRAWLKIDLARLRVCLRPSVAAQPPAAALRSRVSFIADARAYLGGSHETHTRQPLPLFPPRAPISRRRLRSKAVPVEPSDCPVSMFDTEVYFMWGEGGTTSNYERPKTSVYVGKGLPAASRLDRLMNFFTEFFASA